jgi:hypothetical protein
MPYRHAPLVLVLLLPLIVLAFWPSYFARLGQAPLAFHAHALTASLWVLMLIAQSWAIHQRRISLHRVGGMISFLVFPLFLVGGLMVLQTMAAHTATGSHPFMNRFGAGLGLFDILTLSAFAWLYYAALRERCNVQLHARYMLATPLLLLAPVLSRIMPQVGLVSREELHHFLYALHVSNAIAVALALLLWASAPRFGRPFLFVAVVVTGQSLLFSWPGGQAWWREIYVLLAQVPTALVVSAGLLAGALIVLSGTRPVTSRATGQPRPTVGAPCS